MVKKKMRSKIVKMTQLLRKLKSHRMLVIPNYPSKCDIISDVTLTIFTIITSQVGTSASGTSPDVLG